MDTKTISALVILVAATIAVMNMGSLNVEAAKEKPTVKYCFTEGDPDIPGSIQDFCWVSKKVCEVNQASASFAITECFKAPKP